ncbi:MAG TPA: alpha/beta hydrolase [Actinomycetota bacterium]|jgi:pimeloyl-ACP methyl ester carboxylesterase|nr:alpha/beta hydrolase [Actinomycetota bacterium]
MTEFLDLPGGRIAYDVTGEGPLVVCVPGMGDMRATFRLLTPRLAQAGYRVATMDIRGHGQSGTGWDRYTQTSIGTDILALVRHLGGPALWTRYLRTLYPGTKPADLDQYLTALKATLRQPGRAAAFAAMTPMAKPNPIDAMTQAPQVGCPALIVMGTNDKDVPDPKAEAEAVAATLAGPAKIVMIQDAGHYPHAQFPTQTAAAVLDFLEASVRA